MIYDLLTDDEKQLVAHESELNAIDEKIHASARRGDEKQLAALSQRKAELPALIAALKANIARERIAELRKQVALSRADVADAEAEAARLTAELTDKLAALGREQQRLSIEAEQSHRRRDSLRGTLYERENQLRAAERELEQILLSQYATAGET